MCGRASTTDTAKSGRRGATAEGICYRAEGRLLASGESGGIDPPQQWPCTSSDRFMQSPQQCIHRASLLHAQTLACKARSLLIAEADARQLEVADGGAARQIWKALQILQHLEEHLEVRGRSKHFRITPYHVHAMCWKPALAREEWLRGRLPIR